MRPVRLGPSATMIRFTGIGAFGNCDQTPKASSMALPAAWMVVVRLSSRRGFAVGGACVTSVTESEQCDNVTAIIMPVKPPPTIPISDISFFRPWGENAWQ